MADRSIKRIDDQKLKAFSIGAMGNRQLSKRELEELKKKEQEEAAAQVFQEFVATFEDVPGRKVDKTWIKAGTYDAGKRQEDFKDKGEIYRPQPKIDLEKSSAQKAEEYARQLGDRDRKADKVKRKKEGEKKKTNLEMFKEELRMIQEEREERHKYKSTIRSGVSSTVDEAEIVKALMMEDLKMGSFDTGDPNTTNLYLGNLNPKITEHELMEVFGRYGPLASIKIMWPRSDEEKARGRNCGFVAYMSRKDGERALKALNGKDVMQYEMKMGWGKGVPIPPYPIYIPPKLMTLTLPPPPSGLPFNAQYKERYQIPRKPYDQMTLEEESKFNEVLRDAVVKIVIPTDRTLLMLIHRMIEFVIREGPMFEAMIMNKEANSPLFSFLYDNKSPAHTYYRWKLFSMLQGDTAKEWKMDEFRMFVGGSIWRPPVSNPFLNGMPEELIEEDVDTRKGSLSNSQRDRLEDLIHNMTPETMKVAETMVFCIEHSDAADEICDCIMDSISNPDTVLQRKVARLYLISDILHNSVRKLPSRLSNAFCFKAVWETRLVKVFEETKRIVDAIESTVKANGFRKRVEQILASWSKTNIYPKAFLLKLKNAFNGLPLEAGLEELEEEEKEEGSERMDLGVDPDVDLDGLPLQESGDDLDGVPLDGAALLKGVSKLKSEAANFDDIDGVPLDEEEDKGVGKVRKPVIDRSAAFVPSRWESVDPQEAEAQAMTTSKWELLEQQQNNNGADSSAEMDVDSPMTSQDSNADSRRAKLRDIEVKVMQYQDELESGTRAVKPGITLQHQVEHYRKKLLRKAEKAERKEEYHSSSRSKISRSLTPNMARSASASPARYLKSPPSSHRSSKRSRHAKSPSPVTKHRRRDISPELSRTKYREKVSSPELSRTRHRVKSISPDLPARGRNYDEPTSPPLSRARYREKPLSPEISHTRHRNLSPATKSKRKSSKNMPPSPHSRNVRDSPSPPPRHRQRKSPSPPRKYKQRY